MHRQAYVCMFIWISTCIFIHLNTYNYKAYTFIYMYIYTPKYINYKAYTFIHTHILLIYKIPSLAFFT